MKEKRDNKKTKDADQRKMDDVLRKMLNTGPKQEEKKSRRKPRAS